MAHWSITTTSEPSEEPLSLDDAKAFMRVDDSDEDDLIAAFIVAARQKIEEEIMRALVTRSYTYTLDYWPTYDLYGRGRDYIDLPYAPLQSVDSFQYYDEDNTLQTVDSDIYSVDTASEPGRIYLLDGEVWPTSDTRNARASVVISYTAGYGDASDVPSAIVTAMKYWVGTWYENRESVTAGTITAIPGTVDVLLNAYRLVDFE